MTEKQISLLKEICQDCYNDCVVACHWLHVEVDGGFPIVFVQKVGGTKVMACQTTADKYDLLFSDCPLPNGTWHCHIKDNKFFINGKEV